MTTLVRRLARTGPVRPVLRRALAALHRAPYTPSPGDVRFGSLRRVEPISREFGYDRGRPIDRYYIERFLEQHAADVHGRVLEVGDATYTRRYGGDRVTRSDVLHVEGGYPGVTIVADLSDGGGLPDAAFDCVIVTQTLQVVYDLRSALRTLGRVVAPGGVVLATVPGISNVSRYDMERWGHYWSFTSQSARRLFEEAFGTGSTEVEAHGNVLTAAGFLYGLAAEELRADELDARDPDYELLITIRVVRWA